jgi:glycerol uptake facilitator protein
VEGSAARATDRPGSGPREAIDAELEPRGIPAYVAEFLGTLVLVFFIAMILSVNIGVLNYRDFAVIGLLHVFVLMLLIHSLGATSGAHFNPAITAALAAVKKIAPIDAAIYILMQLAGAVVAALLCKLILHDPGATAHYGGVSVADALKGTATGHDAANFTAMLVELIGTFVLMWAIMAMAVNPRAARNQAGLVIGGTLGFAVMAFGPLTGAGFNPARSFGTDLVGGGPDFGPFLLVYVLGPVVGALLAAFTYRLLVLVPQEQAG